MPDRVLIGTRQLGKTTLSAVMLIDTASKSPGSECAYVDLDIEHAEKVIVRDFESIIEKYKIPGNPKLINDAVYFDNGAVIYIFSGRPSEVEKLQGLKFALLIIDEAQDGSDLESIIKMVRPALVRHRGRIFMAGIPGRVRGMGLWWDVTCGAKAHLYGVHTGHMQRNPYLPADSLLEQREKAKAELGEDNPDYQRHWLGKWPEADNAARVYRWDPEKHIFTDMPVCDLYISGTDPAGVRDREATVILGVRNDADKIWAVFEDVSAKGDGGDYCKTAEILKKGQQSFKPLRSFYDYGSAAKGMLATTHNRDFSIYLEPVPPKSLDFEIPRLNALFKSGRLLINRQRTPELAADLAGVHWDLKERAKGRNKYDTKTPHPDVADALRAALWGVPGFAPEPKQAKPQKTEEERVRDEINEMYRKSAQGMYVKKEGKLDAILGRREPLRKQTNVQRRY